MGDPSKLVLLEAVVNVIKKDSLLERVQRSGAKLYKGLRDLQNEFPELINSARGRGTFLSVNAKSPKLRDQILDKLRQKGNVKKYCFLCV